MGNSWKIMIVDDNEMNIKIMRWITQKAFPCVVIFEASSGEVGLELFHKHEPDLVISDITMPGGMSGPEMAKQIHAMSDDTPFIFMSDHAESLQGDSVTAQCKALFLKGTSSEGIIRILRSVMANV